MLMLTAFFFFLFKVLVTYGVFFSISLCLLFSSSPFTLPMSLPTMHR